MEQNNVKGDIEAVRQVLEQVKDPEIPVLTIEDMGIVQGIEFPGDGVRVSITPTYSGCPAMDTIAEDIRVALTLHGYKDVDIKTVLSPAWSTDLISENGKKKLEEFGIAPPSSSAKAALLGHETVRCPQCKSENTEKVSEFGSTACKALYKCVDCLEPFDYFKCV
ncbi:1,2-phenylacetyl-CoA epoxidase subunit PaaD [Sneathiella aquimaris]|uniref:1,2-phenylacetyl-CoA epoxidase subunit PaaD n=1 Tax=Sneathiella aquimaris TaxID=2599305 RepID=UPI00146A0FD2|nr:1,2-phenylacetyl-CoA epoxidase subunit PaaD [Sneathiella aquimaris]